MTTRMGVACSSSPNWRDDFGRSGDDQAGWTVWYEIEAS